MITDVTDSLRGIKSGVMEADKTVIISRVTLFSKFVIMKESILFRKNVNANTITIIISRL